MKRLVLGLCLIGSAAAVAGPADCVYSSGVEYGEREFDFKFGSATPPGDALRCARMGSTGLR